MLDELKTQRKVVGIKQLRRALNDDAVKSVFLAENADPQLIDPIAEICAEKGITLVSVPTMTELGKACGISVGAAVAGILC